MSNPDNEASETRYSHVFDGAPPADSDLAKVHTRMQEVFSRPVRRILFVNAPQIGQDHFLFESAHLRRYPAFPPYGAALMAAIVETHGYSSDLIDLNLEVLSHAVAVSTEDAFHFDIWKTALTERIHEFQPDLVGFSCMFNMGHLPLKDAARHVRVSFPGLPIVAGGVHPSLTAAQILTDIPDIDFVHLYETEESFPQFLAIVNGEMPPDGLSAVATRLEGEVVLISRRKNPPLSAVMPDYKRLPLQQYSAVGKIGAYTFFCPRDTVSATVLSNRGCRAACTFCSVRTVNGIGVRQKEVDDIVKELRVLKEQYGVTHIMWLDDDLFFDNARAIKLFRRMADERLCMTWDASNGIIAAALNDPLLQACVDSGCIGFNIGLESGNEEILRSMRKPGSVNKFLEAAKLLNRYPTIFTKGFLILGYLNESLQAMRDTVDLARRMELDWYPSQILTPMPGTPVFQMLLDQDQVAATPGEVLSKGRTFAVGATGGTLRKREIAEKENARPFVDAFADGVDTSRIPAHDELEDIWLTMDYRMNYESLLTQDDPAKLRKKRLMLDEICERMTSENPLGTLFLGITESKLGEWEAAQAHIELANAYLGQSHFWRLRFDVLGITPVLQEYRDRPQGPSA